MYEGIWNLFVLWIHVRNTSQIKAAQLGGSREGRSGVAASDRSRRCLVNAPLLLTFTLRWRHQRGRMHVGGAGGDQTTSPLISR